MGKRVEIRVDNKLHKQLIILQSRCRFKSVNQLCKHIVQLYVGLAGEPHHTVANEVQEMFEELSTEEHSYIKPQSRHLRTIYDGEK